MIIPIILAGGTGSRLWPLSREHYPKQLLTLVGENSLLQETIKRIQPLKKVEEPIVICNHQYRFLVAEQMLELGITEPKLILEPAGRNTAPAIAMAALLAQTLYPNKDPLLLILPADHLIQETDHFVESIIKAAPLAQDQFLLTFGIQPTYAETGYGYIRAGESVKPPLFKVAEFVEKPKQETAEGYLKEGGYYWNSGMFLFSANTYLQELLKYRKDIFDFCKKESQALQKPTQGFFSLNNSFKDCPNESVDYAVMEKTDRALVFPLNVSWNDVGSWTALHDVLPRDENQNILHGDITCIDTTNSMIRAEHRLIATIGVKDLIIIETKDAIMIAHKNHAQKVKDLVAQLKIQQRKEVT